MLSSVVRGDASHRVRMILAFGAIYVIWGSTYLAIRYAVETLPPFLMIGVRSLIGGGILYLWSRARGNGSFRIEHMPALFTIGISFFLVGHGLLAWAQQHVSSGIAAVLVASEPLWIVTIESLFLRDARIHGKGVAGLVLVFAGLVYLIASTKGIDPSGTDMLASMAVVGGSLSWSGGAVYARVARLPRSPVLSAGMELMIGGAFLLIASYLFGEMDAFDIRSVSVRSMLGLGYLILFGSVVAFSAYTWLLGHTSATRISTHTYVNPIIALLLGWLVAGEPMTMAVGVAAAAIVGSVYLALHDGQKSDTITESS